MSVLPDVLRGVFNRFEAATEPFDEREVSSALAEFKTAHTDLSEEAGRAWFGEGGAFRLHGNGCSIVSASNTYFDPKSWKTDVGIRGVIPEMIGYWQSRCDEALHPVLKARYADAVWDLSRPVTGQRAGHRFAQVAVDAYLDGLAREGKPLWQMNGACRALTLAIRLNDRRRISRARDALFDLHRRIADPSNVGLCFFLFDDLYSKREKADCDGSHVARIVSEVEALLTVWADPQSGDLFNPEAARKAWDQLIGHYWSVGSQEDVRRVTRTFAVAVEHQALSSDPVHAHGLLERLLADYLKARMRKEADELIGRVKDLGRLAVDFMVEIHTPMSIDPGVVSSIADALTAGGVEPAVLQLVGPFVPAGDQLRESLEEMFAEYFFLSRTPLAKLEDGLTRARVGGLQEDEEGRIVDEIASHVEVGAPILEAVLDRLIERYGLTAEGFVELLYLAPIFQEERRPLLVAGMKQYLAGDQVAAIHILVPQVEHALRTLLGRLGGATSKPKREVFHERSLDDVLRDEWMVDLSDDDMRYFRCLLTDPRGLNIRNAVCHGLWAPDRFGRFIADRLVHVLLILSTLRAREPGKADEPEPGPVTHPG
jgi:hypothetical protein